MIKMEEQNLPPIVIDIGKNALNPNLPDYRTEIYVSQIKSIHTFCEEVLKKLKDSK